MLEQILWQAGQAALVCFVVMLFLTVMYGSETAPDPDLRLKGEFMICDNCMEEEDKCKCENGPLIECTMSTEAERDGYAYTGYWICDCGAKDLFAHGTEHFRPRTPKEQKTEKDNPLRDQNS